MDHSRRSSGTGFADDFDEFDLLLEDDEPAEATATASRTGRLPAVRRGGSGSKGSTDGAGRPRLRITPDWNRVAAVILVGVVVLFVLYFIVSSIRDSRRDGAYKDYFGETRDIATQSTQQGVELANILAAPNGGTTAQRIAEIEGLSGRVDKLADRAERLDAPEQLATANGWFATSLRYRANGVEALQRALGSSIESKDQDASAAAVSAAFSRLVASDVVLADSFAVESRAQLKQDGVEGVQVSDSVFAKDLDLYGPKAVTTMLDRLKSSGSATPSGKGKAPTQCKEGKVCGGEVGAPTMTPSGTSLIAGGVVEVKAGENLAFEVPFTNQGEVQLTEVPVKITLRGEESDPITLTGVIESVDPGQQATAKIPLDVAPNVGETLDYDVLVGPIAGEKTADNNRTSGQIRFLLPD
ncbi:MAG: hypothetical protein JWM98_3118 [Thermoleophilia bacterium]|nr:hypothetical protein [Thermoleophilia bacterium]